MKGRVLERLRRVRAGDAAADVARFLRGGVGNAPEEAGGAVEGLRDAFGRQHRYLRVSLTERCSLRCTYCMPAGGVRLSPPETLLSSEELFRLAKMFASAGVERVRLTGGEPTLRRDLPELVGGLRAAGMGQVSLTTNGLTLQRSIPALASAGLWGLNVSLDSLQPEKFAHLTRRSGKGVKRVLDGVEAALAADIGPVKLNCVVMKGVNEDELGAFARLAAEEERLTVRFIEFMPFAGNRWDASNLVPASSILSQLEEQLHTPLSAIPHPPHSTATLYKASGVKGTIGVIASMTKPFCGDCDRLRLTAQGTLKTCLFGTSETDLRSPLRAGWSDQQMLQHVVLPALRKKAPAHGGHPSPQTIADATNHPDARPMTTIGG